MTAGPVSSTGMNGIPGPGGGSTGWSLDAIFTRAVFGAGGRVGVDHIDRPQRQPALAVFRLHEPAVLRRVEVTHRLDGPGRVRTVREHVGELDRDRALQCHLASKS